MNREERWLLELRASPCQPVGLGAVGSAVGRDTFSQSFQEARLNREKHRGNGVYGLFREPASLSASSPAQTEGSASFRLTSGVATLRPEGLAQSLAQSVSVDGGTLSVDFHAQPSRPLSVSSAVLGTESVSANESLRAYSSPGRRLLRSGSLVERSPGSRLLLREKRFLQGTHRHHPLGALIGSLRVPLVGASRCSIFGLMAAVVAWAALQLLAGDVLQQMEDRASDFAWRIMANHETERRVGQVDVDDRSLREIGPWPLAALRPGTVVRPDCCGRCAPANPWTSYFTDSRSGDGILADAVHRHRPLLAQVFALEQRGTSSGTPRRIAGMGHLPSSLAETTGYLANIAALQPASVGHITPRIASDGMVRHQPAVICHRGGAYPALGIAAMMQAADARTPSMERGSGWLDAAWSLTAPQLAPGPIPLDERGDLASPGDNTRTASSACRPPTCWRTHTREPADQCLGAAGQQRLD